MAKIGRPTKLTPEIHRLIVGCLMSGAYPSTAALAAGIDESTFYRWLQTGMQVNAEVSFPDHYAFCKAVQTTIAQAEIMAVHCMINTAQAGGKWQVWAWLLERRFRPRWGRCNVVEPESSQLMLPGTEQKTEELMDEAITQFKGFSRPVVVEPDAVSDSD